MDAQARRQRLEQKLEANSQRRNLALLGQSLPSEIADALLSAPQIFSGDASDKVLFPFLPENAWESEGVYRGSDRPTDYIYKRFGWEHKLITALSQIPSVHESKTAYLYFHTTVDIWNAKFPIFILPLGWLHKHLQALATATTSRFFIVSTDGQQGIYCSAYLGYLEDDWSPGETVHELTIYGYGKASIE